MKADIYLESGLKSEGWSVAVTGLFLGIIDVRQRGRKTISILGIAINSLFLACSCRSMTIFLLTILPNVRIGPGC